MNDTIIANRASQRNNGAIYNRILQTLPSKVREEVLRVCHPVEFPPTHVIYRAGEAVEHAFFIISGLVSLIKGMADGRTTVIGAVGAEGLVGVFAAAGVERALADYIVEVPVAAFRVHRSVLHREMAQHAALRHSVMKYLFLISDRIAEISACNRLHSLEQRCCQWLLVAGDSACSDEFHLTHEFLALLLGVQRSSVSTTAKGLQKRGRIRYSHGHITILDRAALEANACECYRTRRRRIDEAFDSPAV